MSRKAPLRATALAMSPQNDRGGRAIVETRVYGGDQEDRGTSERRGYRLGNGRCNPRPGAVALIGSGFYLDVILAERVRNFAFLKERARSMRSCC